MCVVFFLLFNVFLAGFVIFFFFKRDIEKKTLPFAVPKTYIASTEFIFSRILEIKVAAGDFLELQSKE